MKRMISAVIGVICITAMCIFASQAGFFTTDVGDADANGEITVRDVLLVRKSICGILDENQCIDEDASDVNADGSINMADVIRIRRFCAGIEDITDTYGHVNSGSPVSRLTICGYGAEKYEILIPEDSGDNITLFAGKLSEYIEKASGIALPVVTKQSAAHVIEIRPDAENAYGLGQEGYIIETDENGVVIHGGVPRGCMYGILDFVKTYIGINFNQSRTSASEWRRVSVESGIYDRWDAMLEYRCIRVSGYSGLENFMIPNKTNALEASTDLQSSRYGNGLGRTFANAHSFSTLIESCDTTHQPCLTNQSNIDEATVSVLALIEQREGFGYVIGEEMNQISCSLEDNTDYCQCADCKAAYIKEGSLAGTLIPFVNEVAISVKDEYPEIDLFTIAYYDFRIPPKNVYPVDNLIICYCWNGCNNHTFGSGECDSPSHYQINYNNNSEEKYFLGWAEKTDKLYVWYYVTSFVYTLAPSPNIYNIYDDIRWLYDNGAIGVFVEGSGQNGFEGLKGFLCAKMEENPLMTQEEFLGLMYSYLEDRYGPGWEYILKYIDMQTAAGDEMKCFVNNFEMPFDMYSRSYMAEHYKEMESLFDSAYSMARTQSQKDNIRRSSVHMYFLCLSATYEDKYVNGTPDERVEWESDYKTKLYRYAVSYKVSLGGGGSGGGISSTNEITGSPMMMWYGLDTGARGDNTAEK